jgi:predicted nucleic acid-binding Zn ribbon protein
MEFRNSNEQPLRDAIQALLRTYRLENGIDKVRLIASWEKLMGPAIAPKARIISLKKGVLMIRVKSPALRQELSLARTRIAEMLNDELGKNAVEEVVII